MDTRKNITQKTMEKYFSYRDFMEGKRLSSLYFVSETYKEVKRILKEEKEYKLLEMFDTFSKSPCCIYKDDKEVLTLLFSPYSNCLYLSFDFHHNDFSDYENFMDDYLEFDHACYWIDRKDFFRISDMVFSINKVLERYQSR